MARLMFYLLSGNPYRSILSYKMFRDFLFLKSTV
jgi:hypothetical protein